MSQSNENRITLVLIGVVVMFIICQTPTASFLIYEPLSSKTDPYTENIKRGKCLQIHRLKLSYFYIV